MPKILVVDDNPTIRETLEDLLLVHGYDVRPAEHGRAALDILRAGWAPRLILLDLSMPVMDGYEFLEAVRGSEFADIPLVVRTSLVDLDARYRTLGETYGCQVLQKGIGLGPVLEAAALACGSVRRESMLATRSA